VQPAVLDSSFFSVAVAAACFLMSRGYRISADNLPVTHFNLTSRQLERLELGFLRLFYKN